MKWPIRGIAAIYEATGTHDQPTARRNPDRRSIAALRYLRLQTLPSTCAHLSLRQVAGGKLWLFAIATGL